MDIVTSEETDPPRRREDIKASTSDHHHGTSILPSKTASSSSLSSSSSSSWLRSKDPRIVRVSRAFGGKDRHSKVCTIRGLRDRRVRLSVPTAIQLYDLQERLGLDQPSKVVDWLLDAAKHEIDELPPLPVSPENFSLFNYHLRHQTPLNLNPRDHAGFKIVNWSNRTPGERFVSRNDVVHEKEEEEEEEEEDQDREEDEEMKYDESGQVLSVGSSTSNSLPRVTDHNHPFYGSYYHFDHSGFQTDHQPDPRNLNLVSFPSQILVCPATTQSLFPSPAGAVEVIDPRQMMINHFQTSNAASSQNQSLYSLSQSNNSTSDNNIRLPFQFSMTGASSSSRVLHLGSNSSIGNDDHQLFKNQEFPPK